MIPLGSLLYGFASRALGWVLPFWMHRRVAAAKEDPLRLPERYGRGLPPRTDAPRVWFHGASVGESLLNVAIAYRLKAERPNLECVFTCQTQTAAQRISSLMPEGSHQLMAPADSPAIAKRFARDLAPDLVVFAEGEIWPNLLRFTKRNSAALALVNARMTQASLSGWQKWPRFARGVFDQFDIILAADEATSSGLASIGTTPPVNLGNLKAALPPPPAAPDRTAALKALLQADKPTVLAASTHPGEEPLVLDAMSKLSKEVQTIIAPRHPDRGEAIESLAEARGYRVQRLNRNSNLSQDFDILVADTIGDMGIWFRLADAIFLGGASVDGIGGHNPIEALRLDKSVVTGPFGHNFTEIFESLESFGALRTVDTAAGLAAALDDMINGTWPMIDMAARDAYFRRSDAPFDTAIGYLLDLLPHETPA